MIRVGLIGDYDEQVKAHVAIPLALGLAADALGVQAQFDWLATPSLEQDFEQKLANYGALWTVPASPYASMQGALNGIRYAREHQVPLLGTCGGFQHMLIEFARNQMGLNEADHAEMNPSASVLLVAPLTCSVSEKTHTFRLTPNSKVANIYGTEVISGQYGICNYGLNPIFAPLLEQAGMRIAGVDENGETRMMELAQHPFFVGALFQPERSAFNHIVHPLIKAFLQAAAHSSSCTSDLDFRFEGIDHVQLAAPKGCEEAARQFYGDLLGWTELEKPETLRGRGGVWFKCGIQQVHIGVQASFVPALKAHPGFTVSGLLALKERLRQHGVQILDDELRLEEGYRRFFTNDPFGNRLEFLERVPTDAKERFTNRVEDYVKYRPTYPKEAIDFLYDKVGFRPESVIADVGAGTGIFSKLLLERGSRVFAVEPNDAMREAAVAALAAEERYSAVRGSAEETGLPSQSVDFVVCAQSYHWFDRELARAEFRRILKPGGKAVLIWNSRKTSGTPFLEQFERLLLTYGTDYEKVGHKSITIETLKPYFAGEGPQLYTFTMEQQLDEESLAGRLLSSSYSPLPGTPKYEPMMKELRDIFKRNEENGVVVMEYVTELYAGEV